MRRSPLAVCLLLVCLATIARGKKNDVIDRGEELCNEESCRHGGRCLERENEFGIPVVKCDCPIGYFGEFCEIRDSPVLNVLLPDSPYMHESPPKDAWGKRYETEGIRPFLDNSRRTLLDILQRFYQNIVQMERSRDSAQSAPF